MWLKKQQLYEDFIWNQIAFMYFSKCNIILWVFWPVLMYILKFGRIETMHVGKCTVVIMHGIITFVIL